MQGWFVFIDTVLCRNCFLMEEKICHEVNIAYTGSSEEGSAENNQKEINESAFQGN